MKLSAEITRKLDSDDRKLVVDMMKNSKTIRNLLASALRSEIDCAIIQSEKLVLGEKPELLSKLADLQGYRRGLRHALSIIQPDYEAENVN